MAVFPDHIEAVPRVLPLIELALMRPDTTVWLSIATSPSDDLELFRVFVEAIVAGSFDPRIRCLAEFLLAKASGQGHAKGSWIKVKDLDDIVLRERLEECAQLGMRSAGTTRHAQTT
jgi:hypothetical protein